MSRSTCPAATARSVVIWASFLLALGGWVVAGWAWWHFGVGAGVRPSFIAGLAAATTFTITCSHAVVMPDKVKLYGLGFRDGVQHATPEVYEPEPTRLRAVR